MRCVSIIASSGLLLFTASFGPPRAECGRLQSALVATLARLAANVTGGALRLLSFERLHVFVALPPESPAGIILLLDRDDGGAAASRDAVLAYASALGSRMLASFLDEYGGGLEATVVGAHALSSYREWALRLPAIVHDATRGQLQLLALIPGVERASLIGESDDGAVESFASPDAAPGRAGDFDDSTLVATLRPLMSTAAELRECARTRGHARGGGGRAWGRSEFDRCMRTHTHAAVARVSRPGPHLFSPGSWPLTAAKPPHAVAAATGDAVASL